MPQPLAAGFPPDLQLGPGCRVVVTALDPSTGTAVTGVRLTDVSFFVRSMVGGDPGEDAPLPLLVPTTDAE